MNDVRHKVDSDLASPVRAVADFLLLAVSLIFLFRMFVAEPFEVPTSSMEPTLLGHHQTASCPHCGYKVTHPVPQPRESNGQAFCRNCQTFIPIPNGSPTGGDRVVVSKMPPEMLRRFDVVVFKSPDEASVPYVKRLIGLPGETIRIVGGEIETHSERESSFQICRKPPKLVLAMSQPVYDDRYRGLEKPAHWKSIEREGWRYVDRGYEAAAEGTVSLAYQYRITDVPMVEPIDSSELVAASSRNVFPARFANQVDDLILDFKLAPSKECHEVTVYLHSKRGTATLRWNLDQQRMDLLRSEETLWSMASAIRVKEAKLRFAHVDQSLYLWNDEQLLAAVPYESSLDQPSTFDGSSSPVEICVNGKGTRITDLVLRRDIYYRRSSRAIDRPSGPTHAPVDPLISSGEENQWAAEWKLGQNEYFVLGDNSADSNDSRHWRQGHVLPEKLVLGRVVWNLGSGDFDHFGPMEPR
ncbi:S26 family signal peptidase [bacterium]|nr:S26 family signal peptidase [bacterium]